MSDKRSPEELKRHGLDTEPFPMGDHSAARVRELEALVEQMREAAHGVIEEVETLKRHGRLRHFEHLQGVVQKLAAVVPDRNEDA